MRPNLNQRQTQVQEIVRCGKDPVYFINTYIKIQHPTRGLIQFETYEFQDDCVKDFQEFVHNIVLKSRQLGMSTLVAAYATWMAIFHKDKSVLVIATKLPTAQNFVKKVKVALRNLPPWLLLPKIISENKSEIMFDNGSSITAIPTSDDAGRSEALSLLIVDEAAFIRDFEEIWAGIYPTVAAGGRTIVISTPNGVGGQYHKLWVEAEAGLNEFHSIKLPWWKHPDRDESWFENTKRNLPRRKFSREFLCDFLTSGETFLSADDMEWLNEQIKPPVERTGHDHNVWIWNRPEQNVQYVISADISRGDSADFSTFHVINLSTSTIDAEYKGKVPPDRMGDLLNEYGLMYNKAIVCPENNTFGYTTCMRLKELKYPRLFYEGAHRMTAMSEHQIVDDGKIPGVSMQRNSRVQILSKLEEVLSKRNKALISHSQRLYSELQTFVWNNGRAVAMSEHHDDLVMSLAIGAWVANLMGDKVSDDGSMAIALLRSNAVVRRDINETNLSMQSVGPPLNAQMRAAQVTPTGVMNSKVAAATRVNPNLQRIDFSWLLR